MEFRSLSAQSLKPMQQRQHAAVWFPHALLEALTTRLEAQQRQDPGLGRLCSRLQALRAQHADAAACASRALLSC